ncbi:MAG: succinate dehydrogenase, cytochrome b556 subunit [Limibacillus sp.]|jgi:succinate dehydrogenase / fumarate reductase cytochrome b subunit
MTDQPQSNRPLSPHLQVYKPQYTSILSITHRATGVALAVGTLLLIYWLVGAAGGPESYAAAQGFIGSFFGRLLLFGWSAALFYHLCNGIRHLFWDAGYGFELDTAYKSGMAVLAATGGLTLFSWIIGYVVGG